MKQRLFAKILIVPLLLVLVSCGTNYGKTSITEPIETAKDELKKPDSYYLVKCQVPAESTSDNLDEIIPLIKSTLLEYSDCFNRHNPLTDQLGADE